MGKPLRVSVSLSSLNSENRICTRSSTASVHLPGKIKYDDLKPAFMSNKKAISRTPMIGKTNLVISAASHLHHPQQQQPLTTIKVEDSQKKQQSPQETRGSERLEIPAFRNVGRMEPLRSTPRLNDEVCTDEAYLKRHEKYERQEKSIKRRDRIWQREEQYRLHLMKISTDEDPPPPKVQVVEVVSRMPKCRRHH
uniref:PEHE domain-containing protein n=1 Tax=Ascaris lumbricoides TaxID=6252 RepID=A0A9J2PU59_ASCLU